MKTHHAIARAERRAARAVVRSLAGELGLGGTARVLVRMAKGRLRGEPFALLGAPMDERERLSRRQAADLVLLARAVEDLRDRETAMRIARAAVTAGGTTFLALMIGRLDPSRAAEAASTLVEKFFNAEGEAAIESPERFTFTVSRCRFVELLAAVDASHITPLFCQVDEHYFADPTQPVQLTRHKTLATGGDCCDFVFTAR